MIWCHLLLNQLLCHLCDFKDFIGCKDFRGYKLGLPFLPIDLMWTNVIWKIIFCLPYLPLWLVWIIWNKSLLWSILPDCLGTYWLTIKLNIMRKAFIRQRLLSRGLPQKRYMPPKSKPKYFLKKRHPHLTFLPWKLLSKQFLGKSMDKEYHTYLQFGHYVQNFVV